MRGARGLVLAFAILAAAGAAVLVHKAGRAPGAAPIRAEASDNTVEVLVAARAIRAGEEIGAGDMRWQAWPKTALVAGSIQRQRSSAEPGIEPAAARYPILAGEPIVEAKLVRPGRGGTLASLVAPGMRAVSVPLREETAAGGLIQPQDRVDVLLTHKSRDGGPAKGGSEILLRSVKVLAIGKALDGRGGAGAQGQSHTATLELSPALARRLAGAQSAGDISLALVAAMDPADSTAAEQSGEPEQPVATLKFGRRQNERSVN